MDEELAHDGDEGDLVGFAFGDEALVNGLEEGIAAGGGEGRPVPGSGIRANGHSILMARMARPGAPRRSPSNRYLCIIT
jgi:hypothetical protein